MQVWHLALAALCVGAIPLFGEPPVDAPRTDPPRAAASPVPEFVLSSVSGERVSLYAERPGRIATVLAFLGADCPVSKAEAPKVAQLAREYDDQGIRFVGIDSSGDDSAKAQAFAKSAGLTFPLLLDPLQAVAQKLQVKTAATVVVVDKQFAPIYRGPIDDQCTLAGRKEHAGHDWLVEAIESALAGNEAATTQSPECGTPFPAAKVEPTFSRDIAPILHSQCAGCHRKGQIGPMQLLDYDDAKGWAPQIAEVVGQGRMPPWHANPQYGRFQNERRLTDTERGLLVKWAESGQKEGDRSKTPKPPVFHDEGWSIGKPDLIVSLPRDEEVPAEGVVDYRYILVDPQIKEEKWVQAVEIRPTNTAVTHHSLALYLPPNRTPMDLAGGLRDGSLISTGYFAVQVPGCRPNVYPEGAGKKLEPGCKFLMQMHYTPNGKAAKDRTVMGIKFCKSKPKQEVLTRGIFDYKLMIPPNEPNAPSHAKFTFRRPTKLISMFPHMHVRGKAFRFELERADADEGAREVLLDVPKYDFNWQNFYLPEKPIEIHPGDTMHLTAAYDNSKGNPFNPNPNKYVTWGDQTFEEMMIGYIDYIEESP